MKTFSTEAICAITGSHPACILRWSKAGLISLHDSQTGWKVEQIGDIYDVVNMAASGASLNEIRVWQLEGKRSWTAGWPAHRGELLWQLEYGSDRALARMMRKIDHDYCGDDYINQVLRPLNKWLREQDTMSGATRRLARFHEAVLHRAHCVMRDGSRNKCVPLFLEAISVADETDVWMEAIRLTRQGFDVELSSQICDSPAVSTQSYEHHLLWCSHGISSNKHSQFLEKLNAGQPIRLCGPDTRVTLS
ncbi:transcriptional regulator [Enterobacter sp. Colony194]|uniref:transcriptional regulator n=1 Tax=Enterobacter sp. Colony194 TaxID=2866201 RepID=UPI001C6A7BFD|nr:transcriptional regulator [Enterobacter sp. Colony194]